MTSNKDFCHQYAYALTSTSKRNGNMSYASGIMYSYNTALAKKLDNCTLYNSTRYSNATSKQQGYLINALHGKIIVLDGMDYGFDFRTSQIVEGLTHCYKQSIENLAAAKRASTKERYTAEIFDHQKTLNELLDFKVLTKKDLNDELKALLKGNFDIEKLQKIQKAQKKKEEKARLQRLEQDRQKYKEEVADFRAGKKNNISYGARDLICGGFDIVRIKEDKILTSQGVLIPLADGLILLEFLRKVKSGKIKINVVRERLQENPLILGGMYRLDEVQETGNCSIGCHKFEFVEILRCYEEEYKKQ